MTRPAILALLLACLAALGPLAACGGGRDRPDAPPPQPPPPSPLGGPALVVGTVVDARTGTPCPHATITGPDGTETRTDASGRFELPLARGASGPIVATDPDGRTCTVRLRPLGAGRTEVVLHVR